MKKALLLLSICCFFLTNFAQAPYTSSDYQFREEPDIFYGTATGYDGITDSLFLDLYKPVDDNNCKRPALVMVHGGGFIAGDRKEASLVTTCREMARKGYVVASIKYRLGNHKRNYYVPYAFCDNFTDRCIYVADSSEVVRAIYRGMQDTKGAIRFLKERAALDSTDTEAFFVGGESAGGFISLATAFMDLPSEKPLDCNALPDAPTPDSDLAGCHQSGYSLERPDLGSIDGELHTGNFDASVLGVANFYGALQDLDYMHQGADTPAVYLFHQTTDLVIDCYRKSPFRGVYQYCYNPSNVCQPLDKYPEFSGSCDIRDELTAMGSAAPPFFDDIVNNGNANGSACTQNPSSHSTLAHITRCQNMADLFSPLITATGNDPQSNCTTIGEKPFELSNTKITSNHQQLLIHSKENWGKCQLQVFDLSGKMILAKQMHLSQGEKLIIPVEANGLYIARLFDDNRQVVEKVFFTSETD